MKGLRRRRDGGTISFSLLLMYWYRARDKIKLKIPLPNIELDEKRRGGDMGRAACGWRK
jgi:hypothetical protein